MISHRWMPLALTAIAMFSCTGRRDKAESDSVSLSPVESYDNAYETDSLTNSEHDAAYSFRIDTIDRDIADRIMGTSFSEESPVSLVELRYITVLHHDGHGNVAAGEMICHQSIASDLLDIFIELYEAGYPIERMKLIDDYGGDDTASMEDNNTSCFNVRSRTGQKVFSRHAYGMAVDINPLYNPYVKERNGHRTIEPVSGSVYADREIDSPYRISKGDVCYNAFVRRGFRWGGSWRSSKDYQHFEK